MSNAKFRAATRSFRCLEFGHLCLGHQDTPYRRVSTAFQQGKQIELPIDVNSVHSYRSEFSFFLEINHAKDIPYCYRKCTTLFAKVCLLVASAAISPNISCVAVLLSEKDLKPTKPIRHAVYAISEPPTLTKTVRSCLRDLRFPAS
jgi:hypothetical protein